jgi:vacuolar iron transporter family protein
MTPSTLATSPVLARSLIIDELFDLTLYERLRVHAKGDLAPLLDELISIERRHLLFWEGCFGEKAPHLSLGSRIHIGLLAIIGRLTGTAGTQMILEAIEVFGIRKYLSLWEEHKGTELGAHIAGILRDELVHEDWIVSRYHQRAISPERVRSVFLGFNDGSVEILGAVTGFFVVFNDARSVLLAGATVAVAGSLSMAAGGYASSSSEREVRAIEEDKARFLSEGTETDGTEESPLRLSLVVGVSYFIGAFLPLLPVFFGATSPLWSIVCSGGAILLVSYVLAFLSGMHAGRRMLMNLLMITGTVLLTSGIGYVVREVWGVAV